MFLLLQLPYRVSALLLTSGCKSASQTLLLFGASTKSFKKTDKTKLMLRKPLFIVHGRVKGFLKVILYSTDTKHLSCKSGHGTCTTRVYKR